MSYPIDSLAVAEDGTVRVDVEILRLVWEGLDACSALSFKPTPEQWGRAMGRAEYAHMRLRLWLRDCADKREEAEV